MIVHVLYHLASELHYLLPLRQEIEEAVEKDGWTKKALDTMHKLDSVFKESMRMHPLSVGECHYRYHQKVDGV